MTQDEKDFIGRLIVRTAITVAVIACLLGSCSSVNDYFGVNDDNPVEELLEEAIEAHTGLLIDLSPQSVE